MPEKDHFVSLAQQLSDIHVTILHKEEGAGLGFSLAGGVDLENKAITVSNPVLYASPFKRTEASRFLCEKQVLASQHNTRI